MNTLKQNLHYIKNGLQSADRYLNEDLEAICDETMQNYAEETIQEINKAIKAADLLSETLAKQNLFLDVLTDIAMHVGWQKIEFKDSKERSITLRAWAQEFVNRYADADWENTDYINLVDEFAAEKVNEYLNENGDNKSSSAKFEVSYVFGTEACNEYDEAVDTCKKWVVSSLCDCGTVTTQSFDSQQELNAYMLGVEDASGWLESRKMMTDEQWKTWVEENKEEDE